MSKVKSSNTNYLMLIGIGVFVCLVILTVISLLDLKRDIQTAPQQNLSTLTAATQSVGVCPYCGTQGIPQCPHCSSPTHTSPGGYFCPRCQQLGQAHCPYCSAPMQPQTGNPMPPSSNLGGALLQGNQPVAFRYPRAYPGCPLGTPQTGNQVGWNSNGINNWSMCPNCSYRMFHQIGRLSNRVKCPWCKIPMVSP